MITKKRHRDGTTKVTFALPDGGTPVSVVADFNDWDPYLHPLKKRSNGVRSVAVMLPAGTTVRFRYLSAGEFFDDPDADGTEPNGYGETHTLLCA
jgi:hypothetical protein